MDIDSADNPDTITTMDLDSADNPNWLFDFSVVDPTSLPLHSNFHVPPSTAALDWCAQPAFADPWYLGPEVECSLADVDSFQEAGSRKRMRFEACTTSGSKASREKLRRDRLNERFLELSAILDPGKPLKTDKTVILSEAIRMVTQSQFEVQKLTESNIDLQSKIKELKVEKNELRDEKQRLKVEKEKLEQQTRVFSAQPGLPVYSCTISDAFTTQGHVAGNKLMPFMGYPGVAMWQFMPPAVVDISQDHVLRPPVA